MIFQMKIATYCDFIYYNKEEGNTSNRAIENSAHKYQHEYIGEPQKVAKYDTSSLD